MANKISQVLKNETPYSEAKYEIKRSDGRLPDDVKPKTKDDKIIHFSHIVDSGQYNLRHTHDHSEELAFDYNRLKKEKPKEAAKLQYQTLTVLNRIYKKMGIKLVKAK